MASHGNPWAPSGWLPPLLGVAAAVALEGAAGPVNGVAVDLEDHALVAPKGVDLIGTDADVGLREGSSARRTKARRRRSASLRVGVGASALPSPAPLTHGSGTTT